MGIRRENPDGHTEGTLRMRNRQSGQTLVEYGLVILYFMIVCAVITFVLTTIFHLDAPLAFGVSIIFTVAINAIGPVYRAIRD